jgi:hypothetical protein
MENRQFKAIDETESEDFYAVLKEQGFDPDDFEQVEQLEDPQPAWISGLVVRKACITVRQKKTGMSRRYRAGDDGTAWVVEFSQDLKAGVFGKK